MSSDTVFAKIIAGDLPAHRVYEDERVLAFLDINPLSRGHTLVIPKEPAVTLAELSEESAAAIGKVLPRLCRAVVEATGVKNYNVLQNNGKPSGQAVMHVHFHIIPKPTGKDAESGGGLGLDWNPRELENGEALAERIASALEG